jgi:exonuclease III
MTIGSINIAGVSLFKLQMILETKNIDVLCV